MQRSGGNITCALNFEKSSTFSILKMRQRTIEAEGGEDALVLEIRAWYADAIKELTLDESNKASLSNLQRGKAQAAQSPNHAAFV